MTLSPFEILYFFNSKLILISSPKILKKKSLFHSACRFLGLLNISKDEWQNLKKKQIKISEDYIESKIKERIDAKKSGNYDLADKIRDELSEAGILIEDEKGKTKWKYK